MSEPRLSKILIGILLVGIIAVGLMLFLGEGSSKYAIDDFDNSSLQKFQSSANNISNIVTDINNNSNSLGGGTSQYDIFGGFLKSAWIALRTSGQSVNVMTDMVNEGVSQVPMDAGFNIYLRNMLIAIFVTLVTIAILFHFIRSSNRL